MIKAEDLLAEDAVSPNILTALRDANRRTARFMRLGQAAIGKDIRSTFMNFITVAVHGGDFTTITEALYSIDDASQYNPYTVQVYPGVPKEQYETKAWVTVVFLDKSEEEHTLTGGFTDNDPGAGFVSWAGIVMTYAGTSYVVADGNTNQTYIYWELSAPNVFSAANLFPGITSDDIVVAINTAGIHRLIMMMGGLVSTELLDDLAVNADKLADLAVELGKIADGAVDEDALADLAVAMAKIQDGAVAEDKLAALSVALGKIQDGAVNEDKLAALAVTGPKIAASAVTAAKIAALTITAAEIAANTITAAKIFANTLTANEIAAGAITADELAANSVIAGKIFAGAVTTNKINALAVNAGKIAADAVTATKILAGSVTTIKINAGAVTSDKISVAQLSAIIADMGLLTAGEVRLGAGTPGVNFTGIRIYKSGATYRVAGYNNNVIQAYLDSDGRFRAGAGAVVIDASGIFLSAGGAEVNAVTWGTGRRADIWGVGINPITLLLRAGRSGLSSGEIELLAYSGAGNTVSVLLNHTSDGQGYFEVDTKLATGRGPDLTIAAGVITVTHSFHRVDTAGGAANDNLDTINGGRRGQRLVLMSVASARDVQLRDGVGNIQCGANRTLGTINDTIELVARAAATWTMISHAAN